jgi:hypothetical protein
MPAGQRLAGHALFRLLLPGLRHVVEPPNQAPLAPQRQ